ncbi:MAG: isocitrate dehydrogenase (NADP(+)) [Candidatus Bathyarchaeia archaeon]
MGTLSSCQVDEVEFKLVKPPKEGSRIRFLDGSLKVPENPIVPIIPGDGVGPDVSKAMVKVVDAAVNKAYKGRRVIYWLTLPAGESSNRIYGDPLPRDTLEAVRFYVVSIKGPLVTPVGGGFRSVNVALRMKLDLYACVRPVKWIRGVPSVVRNPEKLDVVIFRENTEDVYAGLEWEAGSPEALKLIEFLRRETKFEVRRDSGIGVKLISEWASKRLVRAAIKYALTHGRRSVTLVHKGNIMKYTEGAFRQWGYEVALQEFRNLVVTEEETVNVEVGGRLLVKDRIADSMFQQVLLRPEEYDVLATMNLNGDYLSDACAAQVGGLGLAPGANINFESGVALFEPTHGAAPKYAGLDKANPSSMILSAAMMLEYMGWVEASDLIKTSLERTILNKTVTYDLHRQLENATLLRCSEFAEAVVSNMEEV